VGEDCTQFVERAFGGRRLFADSPVLQVLGIGARVGDPALPLLRPEATLEPRVARLLRADAIRALPDPLAGADAPNVRSWLGRLLGVTLLLLALTRLLLAVAALSARRSSVEPGGCAE
jgi:hypothetical protein